ncbi:glutamate receptor ionotropic, kainate 1 [Nephila pilipes]|uniref:Glutamate receptor ionotropic, kainate 1 n=1 Tax=Nephila pilipes TaxID=299642 RepID=A0A8X6UD14_NEPPI|nr:glutamate receptor ionotropic, kainate 1 [Nephila pilipes]
MHVSLFLALPRLQDLIMMANEGDIKITLSVLERGLHYRNLLKDVSKKGETNVVLDIPASHIAEILSMAQSFGMMTEYHNYFITSLKGKEDIEDETLSGPSSTSHSNQNVKKVRDMLNSDQRLSVRKLADENEIRERTLHRILPKNWTYGRSDRC